MPTVHRISPAAVSRAPLHCGAQASDAAASLAAEHGSSAAAAQGSVVWLTQVLVAACTGSSIPIVACGIFGRGMWDLVP